jgi:hypothetical protein
MSEEELLIRTLADIDDTPPADLLLGMIEPEGPNLWSAPGGVGKGTTGAWMCGELLSLGMKPMIYDAENRPREWARRVSGLGIDRSKVIYLQPKELPAAWRGRPFLDIAPILKQYVDVAGVDILFVDSILPSLGVGEEKLKSDAQLPYLYVAALLDDLGIPSVSFGHPPKGQPEGEPFGSMAWTAAMRFTWFGVSGEGDGHRIRWRPRKRNERGVIPGVLLEVQYALDGRPNLVIRSDDDSSTSEWLLEALHTGARSLASLAEDLVDETPDAKPGELDRVKERIRKALYRMTKDALVVKFGQGHATKYALAKPLSIVYSGEIVSHEADVPRDVLGASHEDTSRPRRRLRSVP